MTASQGFPTVQWLLTQGGASITEANNEDMTALLCAADGGHSSMVLWFLLEGGASITEVDDNGNTALLSADSSGQLSTVQWLLAEGGGLRVGDVQLGLRRTKLRRFCRQTTLARRTPTPPRTPSTRTVLKYYPILPKRFSAGRDFL